MNLGLQTQLLMNFVLTENYTYHSILLTFLSAPGSSFCDTFLYFVEQV